VICYIANNSKSGALSAETGGEMNGKAFVKRAGVMRAYRFTYRRMSTPRMIPSEMKLIIVNEPP